MNHKSEVGGQRSAAEVFEAFLSAWQDRQWAELRSLTTQTFRDSHHKHNQVWLNYYLKPRFIEQYTMIGEVLVEGNGGHPLNPAVIVDIQAHVRYVMLSVELTRVVTFRLVKECAPYQSDENGKWGVNPLSVRENPHSDSSLEKERKDDEVIGG